MSVPNPNAGKRRLVPEDLERQALRYEFMTHLRSNRNYQNAVALLRPHRGEADYFDYLVKTARSLKLTVDTEASDWAMEYLDSDVHERPFIPAIAFFTGGKEANLHLSVSATFATIKLEAADRSKTRSVEHDGLTIPIDMRDVERAATELIRQWLSDVRPEIEENYGRQPTSPKVSNQRNPSKIRNQMKYIADLYGAFDAAYNNRTWPSPPDRKVRERCAEVAKLLPLDMPPKN